RPLSGRAAIIAARRERFNREREAAERALLPARRRDAAEAADLVAEPRGLLELLQGDGQLHLLLEALDRPDRPVGLDLAPPVQEEPQLGAVGLPVLLVVVAQEGADALDARVDPRQGLAVVALLLGPQRQGPGLHHRDVRPILVELDLVARPGRIAHR